jgi:UTP--glucose-1-phosphate uridylyltransferase
MAKKVRKVIFPVGGFGTRFLPATKALPKEMLPVVDKPIIHYAFEEAQAAGIEQFIFVTGRNKSALENHFDHSYELQSHLSRRNKQTELELTRSWLPPAGDIIFTRQQEMLGLGHAVWCARHWIGDEPFAVILADDMVLAQTPCMKQMLEAHETVGGNMLGVTEVAREKTSQYGIVDIAQARGRAFDAVDHRPLHPAAGNFRRAGAAETRRRWRDPADGRHQRAHQPPESLRFSIRGNAL